MPFYVILVFVGIILPIVLSDFFKKRGSALNLSIDLILATLAVACTGGARSPLVVLYVILFMHYMSEVSLALRLTLIMVPIGVWAVEFHNVSSQDYGLPIYLIMVLALSVLTAISGTIRRQAERSQADQLQVRYSLVNLVSKTIMSTMKLDEVLKFILQHLINELRFDRGFIYLVEEEKGEKVLKFLTGVGVPEEELGKIVYYAEPKAGILSSHSEGIIPRTFRRNQPFLVKDAPNDYNCDQQLVQLLGLKEFLALPFFVKANGLGVLVVDRSQSKLPITEEDVSTLTLIADYAAIAVEHAQIYQKVERMSSLDDLTGAYNHRYFRQAFAEYLQLARRYSRSLSLVIIDVDNFKPVNDQYGHQAGDTVLKRLVEVLSSSLRAVDILARYGGEEFVVLLPEVSREGALKAAERLRQGVEGTTFEVVGGEVNITISLGVASFDADGYNMDQLFNTADMRLYDAKNKGKNSVGSIK